MKLYLIIFSLFLSILACSQDKNSTKISGLYANEYGQIEIKQIDSSKFRTIFKNNKGDVFDTVMIANYDFKRIPGKDSLPFLQLGVKSGIEICPECIRVHEFSAGIHLATFIRIEDMMVRPFYKIREKVQFKGFIKFQKGGPTIDGIYLEDLSKAKEGYFVINGIIEKEKYPIAYYSTDESPQGMFGDTSIAHYRLIMKDYAIYDPPKQIFKGKLINNFGKAAFVWEFADSEVFYLDGKELWDKEMLDKKVTIEGILVQPQDGASVLKKWKIISH